MADDKPKTPGEEEEKEEAVTLNNVSPLYEPESASHNAIVDAEHQERPHQRVFVGIDNRRYFGPDIDPGPVEDTGQVRMQTHRHRYPVYLGPDGVIYDLLYEPMSEGEIATVEHMLSAAAAETEQEVNLQKYCFKDNRYIYEHFPQPMDFCNFYDYEQALLEWKMEAESALGYLRLPSVLGRAYNRPRVIAEGEGSGSKDEEGESSGATGARAGAGGAEHDHEHDHDHDHEQDDHDHNETERDRADSESTLDDDATEKAASTPRGVDLDYLGAEWDFDPWDSSLVPPQPNPNHYIEFEEFELAMRRWASICVRLIRVIPPHPRQFETLIGLVPTDTSANSGGGDGEGAQQAEEAEGGEVSSLGTVDHLDALVRHIRRLYIRHPTVPRDITVAQNTYPLVIGEEWSSLPQPVKQKLRQLITGWCDRSEELIQKFDTPNRTLLPRIHGTFPKNQFQPDHGSQHTAGTAARGPKVTLHLRRKDLTGPLITACMDAPGVVDGKIVEFKTPQIELETFDMIRMASDVDHREELKAQITRNLVADRFDYLNAWYRPTFPTKLHERHQWEVEQIVKRSNNLTPELLRRILSNPMLLDKFQVLLSEYVHDDDTGENSLTYLEEFLNALSPETYMTVLSLFEESNSQLIHAKVAHFVIETLQTNRAKGILEYYMGPIQIDALHYIAMAMSFFADTPLEIFPPIPEVLDQARQALGNPPGYDQILDAVFTQYYLDIISDAIVEHTYLYVAVNYFVADCRRVASQAITQTMEEYKAFTNDWLWRGFTHRSKSVSALFLFLLSQLIKSEEKGIRDMLKSMGSEGTQLLPRLRDSAHSKFSHVQYSVRRTFTMLREDTEWLSFLVGQYVSDYGGFVDDVTMLPRDNYSADWPWPLSMTMAVEVLETAMANATVYEQDNMSAVLQSQIFHRLLKTISAIPPPRHVNQPIAATARMLASISKHAFRLGLIEGSSPDKVKTRFVEEKRREKAGDLVLQVSFPDIKTIIMAIDEKIHEKAYETKTHLIICLRNLLKVKSVFPLIKKEVDVFQRIISFCRDGKTVQAHDFNRNAWRLFYQLTRYHPGSIDVLQKSNQLAPFLEMIGTSSGNVIMMNGLHYVAKLFNIALHEGRKRDRGKSVMDPPTADPNKVWSSDVKSLASFFVSKHLFIKIHMIYKRFVPAYPGAPFLALAEVYQAINTSPFCQKLLRDTMKSPEYKDGLNKIDAMYEGVSEAETSASAAGAVGRDKGKRGALSRLGFRTG